MFEDHRVCCDKGRCYLADWYSDRKVPGSDTGNDAKRLFDCISEVGWEFALYRFTIQPSRFTSAKLGDIDRALQFATGFRNCLTFFASEQLSQLFLVFFH